jgi:hypothetical protein
MRARSAKTALILAAFALVCQAQASAPVGRATHDRTVIGHSATIVDSAFEALASFIEDVTASASSAGQKPSWSEVTERGLELSRQQHGGRPEAARFCDPELKVCNNGVVWRSSKGTKLFLRQSETMDGKPLEREVCELNSFGDVRVCIDWDSGRQYRDMKDLKGRWYKVADQ